jgi:hypothetical protein
MVRGLRICSTGEEEDTMKQTKKSLAKIPMTLLAASLMIVGMNAYADDDPPGNHSQREELRRDQQRLDQLRHRRNRELRQGDRREAREYDEKIRDLQAEIRRDRRALNGDRYSWNRDRDRDRGRDRD